MLGTKRNSKGKRHQETELYFLLFKAQVCWERGGEGGN